MSLRWGPNSGRTPTRAVRRRSRRLPLIRGSAPITTNPLQGLSRSYVRADRGWFRILDGPADLERAALSPDPKNTMKLISLSIILMVAGCGSNDQGPVDAQRVDATDAAPDAAPEAPPACPRRLLTGGTDIAAQGWTVIQQPPATLIDGPDYVEIQTSTTTGQLTSGQLLLSLSGAIVAGAEFKLEVVALVQAVTAHNQFDSAAAIMGSFTPLFGGRVDRGQMIYLDSNAIGWADNTEAHAVAVTDGAYHTYVLAVDASGTAQFTVDGAAALTRANFATNGTIALGDQTNDRSVDSTLRIRSVTLLCL